MKTDLEARHAMFTEKATARWEKKLERVRFEKETEMKEAVAALLHQVRGR